VTIIDQLIHLTGNWQATYRVWMSPTDPPLESHSSAILLRMYNLPPGGEGLLAVEAVNTRG